MYVYLNNVSSNDDTNQNLLVKEQSKNVEKTTDTQQNQNQNQNSPVEGQEVENLKEIVVQLKTTNDLLRFQNSMFVGVLGFFLICYLLYKVFFQKIIRYAL